MGPWYLSQNVEASSSYCPLLSSLTVGEGEDFGEIQEERGVSCTMVLSQTILGIKTTRVLISSFTNFLTVFSLSLIPSRDNSIFLSEY